MYFDSSNESFLDFFCSKYEVKLWSAPCDIIYGLVTDRISWQILEYNILYMVVEAIVPLHSVKIIWQKREGPTEIRTRIVGFKVQSDSHYTIRPHVRQSEYYEYKKYMS